MIVEAIEYSKWYKPHDVIIRILCYKCYFEAICMHENTYGEGKRLRCLVEVMDTLVVFFEHLRKSHT